MEHDYYKEEYNLTKSKFNLEEILDFQITHDIQIIRGEDYQYQCFIDKKCYSTGLTPMFALYLGVKIYKSEEAAKLYKILSVLDKDGNKLDYQDGMDYDIINSIKRMSDGHIFKLWDCIGEGYPILRILAGHNNRIIVNYYPIAMDYLENITPSDKNLLLYKKHIVTLHYIDRYKKENKFVFSANSKDDIDITIFNFIAVSGGRFIKYTDSNGNDYVEETGIDYRIFVPAKK